MASVALIGPDGAGKTTLTRMLEKSGEFRFKYIYMGIDVAASNFALPTSRLARRLKSRLKGNGPTTLRIPATKGTEATLPGGRGRGGAITAAARLANRLADEWYRQLVSWLYERRGFIALYDRHFVFDFSREVSGQAFETFDRRIHRWCLERFYPRPDLVIFLDAPGELLFARKGELTIEELERRRQAFVEVGRRMPSFRRVDATRPLDEVYAEIVRHIGMLQGTPRDAAPAPEVAR